jgi:hypothetical protein
MNGGNRVSSEMAMLEFLVTIAFLLLIGLGIVEYIIHKRAKKIAILLTLAERDFNMHVASGLTHGGRKERVAERKEWNKMVLPGETPAAGGPADVEHGFAAIQYNQAGYKSVAHELVEANEKEWTSKGVSMGKAQITAFLLRELYAGNVKAAQQKIIAETRISAERKPPYVAPGIDVLVGFDKFDAKELRFEKGAGVEKWLLKRAVKGWGFPRDIRWIRDKPDGTKEFYSPWEAFGQLYQQNL